MSARERSTANGLGSNWVDATLHPWPPAEVVIANAFIALLFAHQFQILSIHRCCSRESKLCKTQLPSKDMVDQTLTTFRTVSSFQRVCSKSGNAGDSSRAKQCGVTIGGDEQKNFRIEKADSV